MKLRIGYPDAESEMAMLAADIGPNGRTATTPQTVLDPHQLRLLQQHVAQVAVSQPVRKYLVELADATRRRRDVTLGLSPRGLLTWQRVAQARAHLQGREFVVPDDIQQVAGPVLEVRLAGDFDAAPRIVMEILESVAVPVFPARAPVP